MYGETLGKWRTADLLIGLAYLARRESDQHPCSEVARRGTPLGQGMSVTECQSALEELRVIQRFMKYCVAMRQRRAAVKQRMLSHIGIGTWVFVLGGGGCLEGTHTGRLCRVVFGWYHVHIHACIHTQPNITHIHSISHIQPITQLHACIHPIALTHTHQLHITTAHTPTPHHHCTQSPVIY